MSELKSIVNNMNKKLPGFKATGGYGTGIGSKADLGARIIPDPPAPPVVPTLEPPIAIPRPDDEAAKAAKRRSIAAQRGRSGRASTIFDAGSGLGG